MKWITRSHVHVDRVVCPWLISRFIDSEAEFLFVPRSQIQQVSQETGALPFDAPGVELGHHEGRCSESILLKYELKEPGCCGGKDRHAADVAEDVDTDPVARGLEAIASGFSLRYLDDREGGEGESGGCKDSMPRCSQLQAQALQPLHTKAESCYIK